MLYKILKNKHIFHFFYKKKNVFLFSVLFLFFGLITSLIYAATVTNGDVTIDVLDYDPANGWQAEVIYDGKVTVDFGDTTSLNKEITITLPEGMRFVNYPVVGTPSAGSPGYTVESGSILEQFISSVTEPPKQTYYPSYNGELIYNLTTSCESIEIPFKLTVDGNVYYGPKTITDAITSSASKGGVNIGNAAMDVNGVGSVNFRNTSSGWVNPVTALSGATDPVDLQQFSVYRSGDLYPAYFYAKEYDVYYYYPKELDNIAPIPSANVVETNTAEGYFRSKWNNKWGRIVIDAAASVENVPAGLYAASAVPTFKVTMYDDTVINVNGIGPIQVNVLSSIDNKLEVFAKDVGYYEQSDDYYIVGPRMRIVNDPATDKTNQYVEYTIDPNYEVIQAVFPKDPTLGVIGDVEYKTNLNSTLRVADPSDVIAYGTTGAYISNESLGLSANEYITYVNASIGGVSKGFRTQGGSYLDYMAVSSRIIGKLKDGINTANVTMRTYARLPDNSVEPNSESSVTKAVNRLANPTASLRATSSDMMMNAGETKNLTFTLTGAQYYYSDSLGLIDPKAYIRIPENTEVDLGSITVTSNYDGALPHTVTGPYTSAVSGERFLEIAISGKVGSLYNLEEYYTVALNFDLIAGLGAGGNYPWEEYVFWRDDVGNNYTAQNSYSAIVSDTLDVDNDGNVTERLAPADDYDLIIISKQELLIDTYIIPEGGERQVPYDGTQDTAVGFTPGTTAKYTIDFLNNRTDAVNSTTAYIPIPKDGNNYGTNFQNNEFYWNMKLSGTPTVTVIDQFGTDITATAAANYAITYSEDATSEANYQSATYTGSPSTNTTMIKVENTTGIPAGEQAILEFDYVVDETIATVQADPTKLGATNDFRPYYYFSSGTSGWQSGTKVGAILQIGQIAGQVFLDQDIDGIYNNTDILLENRTIDLYRHDGSAYVFHSTTVTDISGHYAFDELPNGNYRVNFTNVPTATQQFTKKDQGTDESLDSDAYYTGTQRGYVNTIDPTDATARNTDAGIINYDPTTQLDVTLNKTTTSIKKTNAQTTFTEQLTQTITPVFFDSIKATTQPIVWSSSNPATVSVSNGLIQGAQVGTATITMTITDMYGNTDTAQTIVTVTSNDIPTITASNATIDLNVQFDPLENITASDTEDGNITHRIVITASNVNVQTPGVYTITYAVEDNDGNAAQVNRTITVRSVSPTVTTGSVSNVSLSQATLNATVTATGGEEVTRAIEWGTGSGTYTNTCTTTSGTEGQYACTITDLTQSTTYYYRAKVTNSVGTGYGQEKSFATETAQTQRSTISTEGTITITGDAVLGGG